jgi:alpha-galactosidase
MLAGPLILARDLRDVTAAIDTVLHNVDLIAIAQDSLAIQGRKVCAIGDIDIWSRPLSDGATALAFFSRERRKTAIQVNWSQIALPDQQDVRDIWKQAGLGQFDYTYRSTLPAHGTELLKVSTAPR